MGIFPGFGNGGAVYRFSRRIGRGGMGEVYLGLQEGIGGLERLVVLKRIDPQRGDTERFTRLLLEEARLAASIHHPNVVQMVDIGHDTSGYFLVMEYLSGESLLYIMRRLGARGQRVPPAIACRIAAEVAAGLHCAHTATDAAGGAQRIVHRDVTPSNLIVCFNGAVKIVDFGVARANSPDGSGPGGGPHGPHGLHGPHGPHGLHGLHGKMSYLAPEQLHGREADARTDVFQLGICLHELLTGRRLFGGNGERQRAAAVLSRPILPPSEIVPALPGALDKVALWALHRDPGQRPATADEFRRALETAAAEGGIAGHRDLGAWMTNAFGDRQSARLQFERRCVAEMRGGRSRDSSPAALPDATPPHPLAGQNGPAPPKKSGRSWILLAPAALVGFLAATTAIAWNRDGGASHPRARAAPSPAAAPRSARLALARPSPRSFDVSIRATPDAAVIEIDGFEVGRGSYRVSLPMDGTRHVLTVRAAGFEPVRLDFSDEPPPGRIQLDPIGAAGEGSLPRAKKARRTVRQR